MLTYRYTGYTVIQSRKKYRQKYRSTQICSSKYSGLIIILGTNIGVRCLLLSILFSAALSLCAALLSVLLQQTIWSPFSFSPSTRGDYVPTSNPVINKSKGLKSRGSSR